MGLTVDSVGKNSIDSGLEIRRRAPEDRVVAIAGNPNVGKSTLFNALTGMNQHTGNWPGKTVSNAQGYCASKRHGYVLVDIPGTYSLMAHSAEEEVARNFICFGEPDATVIVCDATCLERNLNLVLQTLEICGRAVICVNLVDEAEKKGIRIDYKLLSQRLGVPVVPTVARKKRTLRAVTEALDRIVDAPPRGPFEVRYADCVEAAIAKVQPLAAIRAGNRLPARWLSLKLLDPDESLLRELTIYLGENPLEDEALAEAVRAAREESGLDEDAWRDAVVTGVVRTAERVCQGVITNGAGGYSARDRRIDRLLTGRHTAYPLMLLMLAGIFWLTIVGANAPSALLSRWLFGLQDCLTELFMRFHAPEWLHGALVLGVYRVLAWVVAVMLPPMAIFFPLFTLLEDAGYLPRVAYNLDCPFKKCCACGKQALTMCMGFGCNAAGVVGCRIIDSPRERMIAILTNSFVPCNGRFPTLIALITMFFALSAGGILESVWAALMLMLVVLLGVGMTFAASKLLSKTLLRGAPSSFTLELPPYRRPQLGKVLVRSVLDRTLFVLGRAAAVAAPAGLIIWLMANVTVSGCSLLSHCAAALDPFARLMGLDGVILMAFILGLPANEIVMPIALMAYLAQGTLMEPASTVEMKRILVENGWTWLTALCTMLFSMFHWPCSTTLSTIHKETGSWKWTAIAAVMPAGVGVALCLLTAGVARLIG